ncbi:MAG: mycoredoxin-dependent peroxiredoxin, partial [Pseudonocardiales bacterium]|nr:mycoredoxin-dependent peroxiredoxin [Pseudonocardiales bacterium]
AVSISVDSAYVQKIFSQRESYEFPMLSDFWPHGGVAKSYGVFNEDNGFANRGTFLVDKDGIVRFAQMNGPGEGRNADDWRDAITKL